ncbi:MAG TPA: hypothetical protein VHD56_17090 [Tepidisphaeraceae bacterium]|nr:hypothetical protein [Tepidisphaeraceae bacterium]
MGDPRLAEQDERTVIPHLWKHASCFYCGTIVALGIGVYSYPFFIHAGYPGGDLEGFLIEFILFAALALLSGFVIVPFTIFVRVALSTESGQDPSTEDRLRPGLSVGAAFGLISVIAQALAWKLDLMHTDGNDPEGPYWLFVNWIALPIVCGDIIFRWTRPDRRHGFPLTSAHVEKHGIDNQSHS